MSDETELQAKAAALWQETKFVANLILHAIVNQGPQVRHPAAVVFGLQVATAKILQNSTSLAIEDNRPILDVYVEQLREVVAELAGPPPGVTRH